VLEIADLKGEAGQSGANPFQRGRIYIIGPNMLQNELLQSYMEKALSVRCLLIGSIENLSDLMDEDGWLNVVMVDCRNGKHIDPWAEYRLNETQYREKAYLVFFNANQDGMIERHAIERGVKGIFYHQESYKILPKGIRAIVSGELWYPRKTICQAFLSAQKRHKIQHDKIDCLTSREKEILIKIASGSGNREIADMLCISHHTVKTHIYNIYKKIDVKNRLQASHWAAKCL
jgi:DNA-binding NarL/FixJ family response regulator